ncbi:MAG: Unknown protein [uncultured Thiotrichaceae bacterium]|uniref:Rhodanese domain-containing protein n=1 Tax=uncultured Thiotrichaceae bacterium TaxID=298394 RepID=A0A6S6U483_9GAMM|nr:MAG: Unknown protein [uncultured Thiotrichaceae bacterium]
MKMSVFTSAMVLATLTATHSLQAEDTMPKEEKGVLGSMADAVKTTAKDIKNATVGDIKTTPATGEADDENTSDDEPSAFVQKPANAPVVASEVNDAADAEANRKVSDTSVTILSQNDYIKTIMQKTTHIKVKRLKEIMEKGEKFTLLDIRPKSEFAKGNGVKGAILNIPRNFLEVEAYEKLTDRNARIIVISSKGIRGGLAAHTLQEMGYTQVRNLIGGVEAWNK